MGKLKLLFGLLLAVPLLIGIAVSDDEIAEEPIADEVVEQVCET